MGKRFSIGSSVRSAWRALTGQLTLRREGGKLRVAVDDKPAAKSAAPRATPAAAAPQTEDQRMTAALAAVLDPHPRSRKVFRHLAVIEVTLRKQGAEGVKQLPPAVVATALSQLQGLVDDWSGPGLTALRRMLSVEALESTQPNPALRASEVRPSGFNAASRLQVTDISVSEFNRVAGVGASRL